MQETEDVTTTTTTTVSRTRTQFFFFFFFSFFFLVCFFEGGFTHILQEPKKEVSVRPAKLTQDTGEMRGRPNTEEVHVYVRAFPESACCA